MLSRSHNNPILTAGDLSCKAFYILNPGAVKFNGEYLLLVDVFHVEGGIIFWLARSNNGYDFKFDPQPVKWPKSFDWWEENGVYDPRITKFGDDYLIMYGSHTTPWARGWESLKPATLSISSGFQLARRSTIATGCCFRKRSTADIAVWTVRSAAGKVLLATCG